MGRLMFYTRVIMDRLKLALSEMRDMPSDWPIHEEFRGIRVYQRELQPLLNDLTALTAKWDEAMVAEYGPRTA
jgi:hypothetical protein